MNGRWQTFFQFLKRVRNKTLPVCKKGKEEDPANYRSGNLAFGLCKILKKIMLGVNEKPLNNHAVIGQSQHGFMQGKLINL